MELCYDIATEGFSIDGLKNRIKTIFDKIKTVFQNIVSFIKSFITKALKKVFHIKTCKINRAYYHSVMDIIHKVEAFDVSYDKKIALYINSAKFNEEKVHEIYLEMVKKMEDLSDLEHNMKAIKAPTEGPVVELPANHFELMLKKYQLMQANYAGEIKTVDTRYNMLMTIASKAGVMNDKINGEYTINQFIESILQVSMRNARLNMMKVTLLLSLTKMLILNLVKEEDNSDYKENVQDDVNPYEAKHSSVPVSHRIGVSNESLINFTNYCDDMMI